jgi:drug/metabolite transporter (DMT)-like permease
MSGTAIRGGGLIRLAFLALIWGSSFLWMKIGLRGAPPVGIALMRIGLGALVLLSIVWIQGTRLPRGWTLYGHIAVVAFFLNALPYTLFAVGEQTVDSSLAGVLNSTTPLWALLISFSIGRRPTLPQFSGLLIGFAGVMMILAPWQASGLFGFGSMIILGAALSYGAIYMYMEKFISPYNLDPVALCAVQLGIATVMVGSAVPFFNDTHVDFRWDSFAALVVLGVFGTGIAVLLNYYILKEDGAQAATMVGYLLPVVSVLLGAAALGEELTLRMIGGMVVVIGGVWLTRRKKAVAAPEPAIVVDAKAVQAQEDPVATR